MPERSVSSAVVPAKERARGVLVWMLTILVAAGIGLAGVAKFLQADAWRQLFVGWGYPSWMSPVTGVVEVVGAIVLLVPRTAVFGAMVLGGVMGAALITLLTHSGGRMGWGATPLVYLVLLAIVGVMRWRRRSS